MKLLGILLDIVHLLIIFFSIILYLIPVKYLKKSFKYIFLVLILTPIHWNLFNNKCILTIISKKLGSYDNMNNDEESESLFSKKYLKWLYKPIMKIIGWEWKDKNISKMAVLHWIFNYILLWYYLFFIGKEKIL